MLKLQVPTVYPVFLTESVFHSVNVQKVSMMVVSQIVNNVMLLVKIVTKLVVTNVKSTISHGTVVVFHNVQKDIGDLSLIENVTHVTKPV
jgi:hypothetical protein